MSVPFTIKFRTSISKDLKKVPSYLIPPIISLIEELANNPYPSGCLKLTDTDSYYRIRKGHYRIIYEVICQEHRIEILYIRHRKNVYERELL
jgi:mRNA interferase RelE/StbE